MACPWVGHTVQRILISMAVTAALQALFLLLVVSATSGGIQAQPIVPAIVSFGDSTIDVGNNNYLPGAVFKADYAPYGVNFRRHEATGRFSDGKIVTDMTADTLGFDRYAPPYLSPQASGKNLLIGANFASAASSYYDDTAAMYDAITLTQQLKYYKEYQSKLAAVAGRAKARAILSDALYVVSTGTGDFLQNYYHNASLSRRYDVDRYCDLLVGIFSNFANELYKLGARRIGVTSMPPLGCLPASIRLYGAKGRRGGGCVARLNRDAETFNRKLNATVRALKTRHADLKIAIFDIYTPLRALAEAPAAQGFADAKGTCCRTGTEKTRVYLCNPTTAGTCRNATSYVFFDGVHPSEAANVVIAQSMVDAGIELVM